MLQRRQFYVAFFNFVECGINKQPTMEFHVIIILYIVEVEIFGFEQLQRLLNTLHT